MVKIKWVTKKHNSQTINQRNTTQTYRFDRRRHFRHPTDATVGNDVARGVLDVDDRGVQIGFVVRLRSLIGHPGKSVEHQFNGGGGAFHHKRGCIDVFDGAGHGMDGLRRCRGRVPQYLSTTMANITHQNRFVFERQWSMCIQTRKRKGKNKTVHQKRVPKERATQDVHVPRHWPTWTRFDH